MFLDCPFEAGGHQIRVNTMKLFKTMATIALVASSIGFASCSDDKNEPADGNDRNDGQEMGQRRSSVARVLTKYPADAVHEERQVRDTVQL